MEVVFMKTTFSWDSVSAAGGSSLRNGPYFMTYINFRKQTIRKPSDLFGRLIPDVSQYALLVFLANLRSARN